MKPLLALVLLAATPGMTGSEGTFAPARGPVVFVMRHGGTLPEPQAVGIFGSGAEIGFWARAETQNPVRWLGVTTVSAKIPGAITVFLTSEASDLAAGSYSGSIVLHSAAATNDRLRIPVRLEISRRAVAMPKPSSIRFQHQLGGPAAPLSRTVSLGKQPTGRYQVSTETDAEGNWLLASPGSAAAPTPVTVTVDPRLVREGRHTGVVLLTPEEDEEPVVRVPVELSVSRRPLLRVSPDEVQIQVQAGSGRPEAHTIRVASTGDPVNFDVAFARDAPGYWLSLDRVTGIAPGEIRVEIDARRLDPGLYTATVIVTARDGNREVVPVTVRAVR